MTPASSPLLSRKEVADLLNISTRTAARWELSGLLKPVRLSRRAVRYHPTDVQRLVAESQCRVEG